MFVSESGFVEFEEFSVFMADFLRITGTNELIELREAFRFFDKGQLTEIAMLYLK